MARTDELERTLDYMYQQLEQLDIVRILPGDLEEYRVVINRAMDIRSACMVYVACHILHEQTNFGLVGILPSLRSLIVMQNVLGYRHGSR
jgi:hypothetical protein